MRERELVAELKGLPQRPEDSHKGDYGKLLLIGGSCTMPGAIALSAMASLRSGAGLVTVATAEVVHSIVAGFDPCFMTIPLCCSSNGTIKENADSLSQSVGSMGQYDAIAIGPGLGKSTDLMSLVSELYEKNRGPLIVDADALNLLAGESGGLPVPNGPRVLTPHEGEFVRLMQNNHDGLNVDGVLTREDFEQAAFDLAGESQSVIALKGNVTFGYSPWNAMFYFVIDKIIFKEPTFKIFHYFKYFLVNNSAIWTEFSAAPFLKLSATTQSPNDFLFLPSLNLLKKTLSSPADSSGVT